MDNEEAKFILQAYRSNGADADDPAFREALEQARRDPALHGWFSKEQSQDQAIAGKLKSVPLPPGLRDSILAGARAGGSRRTWWRHPGWFALAAALVVAIGASFFWRRAAGSSALDQLAAFAAHDLLHGQHGGRGEEVRELAGELGNPATRLSAGLPLDLTKLGETGCRTLTFAGREVMEICFVRGGTEFHLYALRREGAFPARAAPRFLQQGAAVAMAWTDAKFAYVVATTAGVDKLKALL